MILTCPECATRYFVPDSKVGPNGRTVKCASCGNRWTAHAEPDLELITDDVEGAVHREAAAAATPAEAAPELSALPGEELPKAFRQKATNERKVREAAAVGVVWAGMTAALMVLLALSVVFRENVVKVWPKAASVYAKTPFAVNPSGLTIEGVKATPTLQSGHAALAITGIIRNVQDHAVMSPAMKVSLISADGKRVGGKVAAAEDPMIPPGETRHFAIVLLDPPANSSKLDVRFVDDPSEEKAVRSAVHLPLPGEIPAAAPADPGLRGHEATPSPLPTAPVAAMPADAIPSGSAAAPGAPPEAVALPPGSPHALPEKPSHD